MARRKRRQNPDTTTLLLYGGVAVAAYFAYKGWQGSQEAVEEEWDDEGVSTPLDTHADMRAIRVDQMPHLVPMDVLRSDPLAQRLNQTVKKGMIKKEVQDFVLKAQPFKSYLD